MGASRADAEDAAQEAMIAAWARWESIEAPTAYARTVAVRAYLRQVRQKGSVTALTDQASHDPVGHPDLDIFTLEQQRVLSLLRGLPPAQRTVAALYYDGFSCKEIAELTGKPAATIRANLRDARKALKGMI